MEDVSLRITDVYYTQCEFRVVYFQSTTRAEFDHIVGYARVHIKTEKDDIVEDEMSKTEHLQALMAGQSDEESDPNWEQEVEYENYSPSTVGGSGWKTCSVAEGSLNLYEPVLPEGTEVTYTLVEGASRRDSDVLVDSMGYGFTFDSRGAGKRGRWVCVSRSNNLRCHAMLKYRNGKYERLGQYHIHAPQPNTLQNYKLSASIKRRIRENPHQPLRNLVTEELRKSLSEQSLADEPANENAGDGQEFEVLNKSRIKNMVQVAKRYLEKTYGFEATIDANAKPRPEVCENIYEPPLEDSDVTRQYDIIDGATFKGGPKLVDNVGYDYTQKKNNSKNPYWACSVRTKNIRCYAAVIQKGLDCFKRLKHPHNHPPAENTAYKFKIHAELKAEFINQPEKSCIAVVQEIYDREKLLNPDIFPCLTKPEYAAKIGQRVRSKMSGMHQDPRQNEEYVKRINSEINACIASQPERSAMQIAREIYDRERLLNPDIFESLPTLEWAAKRGKRLMQKANRANMSDQADGNVDQSEEQSVRQDIEVGTEQPIQIAQYPPILLGYDPQQQQLGQYYY